MPATEWLNKYQSVKDKLACKADLETYFTENDKLLVLGEYRALQKCFRI